jgi:hypothetical protein
MESPSVGLPLLVLLISWAAITAALFLLWIYKSRLQDREEDQLFLDAAEEHMAAEQRALVARLIRLNKPMMILGVLSGVLLILCFGVWIWEGLRGLAGP